MFKQTEGWGNANIPNCLNSIESFLNKQVWGKHQDKYFSAREGYWYTADPNPV